MALLKAFMCQLVLFGLYKLFLEQIIEDHLVQDDFTRNCLAGFVCLLCFGIQLYTEKADDDYEEDEEALKGKSESKNATAEVSATHEITTESIGRSSLNRVTVTNAQNGLQETVKEKKISSKDPPVADSMKNDSIPLSTENGDKQVPYSSIFTDFSTNTTDVNGNDTREGGIGKQNATSPTIQKTKTIPKLNGFTETDVCEESDEDGIEIDQMVAKESLKDQEKFRTVENEEIKLRNATETEGVVIMNKIEKFAAFNLDMTETEKVEAVSQSVTEAEEVAPVCQSVTEAEEVRAVSQSVVEAEEVAPVSQSVAEAEQVAPVSRSVAEAKEVAPVSESVAEAEEVAAVKLENASEAEEVAAAAANQDVEQVRTFEFETKLRHVTAAAESENLKSDGQNIPSSQNLENIATLAIGESEVKIANGTIEESFSNIDSISSNIIERTDTILSVGNRDAIGVGQEMNSPSETEECIKDIVDTPPPTQEINDVISTKEVETADKCNAEASTLEKLTVSSPSQEPAVQSQRRRISAADVCVAPLTIDISFIYACH